MKDKNYNKLSFWISLFCVAIAVLEVFLNMLGITFEFKIIIEIVSLVLAILVSIGILKSNKNTNDISQIKDEIKSEIEEKSQLVKSELEKTSSKNDIIIETKLNNKLENKNKKD